MREDEGDLPDALGSTSTTRSTQLPLCYIPGTASTSSRPTRRRSCASGRKVANDESTYTQINSREYTDFLDAIRAESCEFNEKEAFSEDALSMVPYKWWETYCYDFDHLSYVGIHIGALRIERRARRPGKSVFGWMSEKRLSSRGT